MTRVVVISAEPVGESMLGSAIRAYELARALAPHGEVRLAAPEGGDGTADLEFARHDARALRPLLERADFVITQPPWPHVMAELRRSPARLVFDLYDPEPLENLELLAGRRALLRRGVATLTLDRFMAALRAGEHFLCASESQRALYIGMLLGERLLPPRAYDADPTLRSRLSVVPFGVSDTPPGTPSPGPRELLDLDGELVLWNGGLWPWLDAPTAIRAVTALDRDATLLFMGGGRALEEARAVAGDHPRVVFNAGWVPYERRAAWLNQADCAISTHRDHLETRFAFRTRLLDCFWAGLPIVATSGDDLAARVEQDDLGATAPPGDVAATAAALERVLDRGRDAYGPALAATAEQFRWSRVVAPLVAWLQDPPPRRARSLPPQPRDVAFRAALRVLGRWPSL
ncbi:glycosyltransferase [Solirubrobacter sp. CPCC 204708]|nr:glycosyltransferase [Solirubrobacter deserti]